MLRAARERAGLSQSQLGAATGIRRAYVHKLENSERCPSLVVAKALCGALTLSEDDANLLLSCAVDDAGRSHPARAAA
ncbi:helix-turn-helix transcriptional regulator [Streptomyces sp. NPDC050416]|uniref:helix-turn-helix transcriptional regulator n=1 Tax=Streptomyces sp. NPDC050416 TaxID=3365611 RepID=UPI00379D6B9C